MRMIPPVMVSDNHSGAERQVFALLQGLDDEGEGWRCFHSLNLAHHEYKVLGELDFLVLTPRGLMVLEVKGGGVSCNNGLWTFTDRFGTVHRRSESPFQQAKSGMFSLRRTLEKTLSVGVLDRFAFGYGAIFPDCEFDVRSIEWPPEVVLDARRIRADKGLRRYLRGLLTYWRGAARVHATASREDLDNVTRLLRPDFDLVPSLRARADQLGTAMERLTEAQYAILDAVEAQPRLICEGGAGTGKTFLAVEAARRHAARGQRVLVTARSPHLVRFLAERLAPTQAHVKTYPFTTASRPGNRSYDVLVVDEGQDVLDLEALAELDSVLVGGIEQGIWRVFVDVNNQSALLGHFTREGLDLLEACRGVPIRLSRNCRNTHEIVIQTKLRTGADLGTASAGHGPPFRIRYHDNEGEAVMNLTEYLESLDAEGVSPGQITILSAGHLSDSCASRLPAALRRRVSVFEPSSEWPSGSTVVSEIADFKGLENDFVALVDIERLGSTLHDMSLLYVAMSRARTGLWMGAHHRVEAALEDLAVRNLPLVEKDIENAAR
jgi:hypothetical protein